MRSEKKSVDKLFDKRNNVIEGENTKRALITDYLFVLLLLLLLLFCYIVQYGVSL
jgi:hypothetical protein